jgi:hypothetical protein
VEPEPQEPEIFPSAEPDPDFGSGSRFGSGFNLNGMIKVKNLKKLDGNFLGNNAAFNLKKGKILNKVFFI